MLMGEDENGDDAEVVDEDEVLGNRNIVIYNLMYPKALPNISISNRY
jgi:hypothetical protein